MSDRRTYRLATKAQRERFCRDVMRAPENWIGMLAEGTRSLLQNAKLHAMLTDVQRQDADMRQYSLADMKLRFLDALGTELRFLPKLENQGMFPVGLRTSTLTLEQCGILIDLVGKYGAEHGIVFSDESSTNPQGAAGGQQSPAVGI
jgi:hypothetical protein